MDGTQSEGARFGVRLLFVSEDGVAQICKKNGKILKQLAGFWKFL